MFGTYLRFSIYPGLTRATFTLNPDKPVVFFLATSTKSNIKIEAKWHLKENSLLEETGR